MIVLTRRASEGVWLFLSENTPSLARRVNKSIMRNLKLTVAYDGTDFGGWQTQPNARTVQATLEAAIASITQEERIRCNASGRTDSGVHALGQVVNFFTETKLDDAALVKAINAKLPEDLAVLDCCEVHQSFCANRDAIGKRYRYVINDSHVPDIFLRRYAWQPRRTLDAEAMHRAAAVFAAATIFEASRRTGRIG